MATFLKRALLTLIGALTLLSFSSEVHAASGKRESLYVQVRTTKLRSSPVMWASGVADLSYGDKLEVVSVTDQDRGWLKVAGKGATGYIHVSSVTPRKVVLSRGSSGSAAQADPNEVVLAGKGFNKEVEKQFAQNQSLDFGPVNRVEQVRTSSGELQSFVRDGQLKAEVR